MYHPARSSMLCGLASAFLAVHDVDAQPFPRIVPAPFVVESVSEARSFQPAFFRFAQAESLPPDHPDRIAAYTLAGQMLLVAMRAHPSSLHTIPAISYIARSYEQSGRYYQAIEAAACLLRSGSSDAWSVASSSLTAHCAIGRSFAATEHLVSPEIRLQMSWLVARSLDQLFDENQALSFYNLVLNDPNLPEISGDVSGPARQHAMRRIAEILLNRGAWHDAETAWRRLLQTSQFDSDRTLARFRLAQIALRRAEEADTASGWLAARAAMEAFRSAQSLTPDSAEIVLEAGRETIRLAAKLADSTSEFRAKASMAEDFLRVRELCRDAAHQNPTHEPGLCRLVRQYADDGLSFFVDDLRARVAAFDSVVLIEHDFVPLVREINRLGTTLRAGALTTEGTQPDADAILKRVLHDRGAGNSRSTFGIIPEATALFELGSPAVRIAALVLRGHATEHRAQEINRPTNHLLEVRIPPNQVAVCNSFLELARRTRAAAAIFENNRRLESIRESVDDLETRSQICLDNANAAIQTLLEQLSLAETTRTAQDYALAVFLSRAFLTPSPDTIRARLSLQAEPIRGVLSEAMRAPDFVLTAARWNFTYTEGMFDDAPAGRSSEVWQISPIPSFQGL